MNPQTAFDLLLGAPLFGAALLAFIGHSHRAAVVNILIAALTLAGAVVLALDVLGSGPRTLYGQAFFLDSFNTFLVVLTAFVATTTALFSRPYMAFEARHRGLPSRRMRLYHAMVQLFIFGMLLALTTNNLGVMWVALELATMATVLLVSLYRTPDSIEAAWKYFILCGVGIAQALFGTVLIFFAATQVLGHGNEALTWTALYAHADDLEPVVMGLAFAFLMVGYGTKVGLVPLHAWLPDAHSEGPTPVSAVLSGLLLNVALYALVRCKVLVEGATGSTLPGTIMIGFGLTSFLVAAFFLHKQRDIKRMYAYSSVEHMGLMTLAFGIGTHLATVAGLLHMTVHSLVKSGIFFTVGHAAQAMGSQAMPKIRGLIRHSPGIGWGLLIGTLAIAGFPPFGLFVSELLLLTATVQSHPWITVPLLFGLVIAFAGLFRHLQPMVFGNPPPTAIKVKVDFTPVILHLTLALLLGLMLPNFLSDWFETASNLLTPGGG
ncbi:MAG: hydrogenase 4 subunit F [Alphaproteobacteria bacterium CG_4_10_14_0_2_um_filter_63_37]|nr:MAG: hydrogenase 4 subunit F [Proteobacteria bacterium CG1_02_64_396]PJA25528.1 MAG: hydrogenase 4 subunit F [Alphaproteobacteria bacterium CG_4_10_14_0_2_um_filter_63_37]